MKFDTAHCLEEVWWLLILFRTLFECFEFNMSFYKRSTECSWNFCRQQLLWPIYITAHRGSCLPKTLNRTSINMSNLAMLKCHTSQSGKLRLNLIVIFGLIFVSFTGKIIITYMSLSFQMRFSIVAFKEMTLQKSWMLNFCVLLLRSSSSSLWLWDRMFL